MPPLGREARGSWESRFLAAGEAQSACALRGVCCDRGTEQGWVSKSVPVLVGLGRLVGETDPETVHKQNVRVLRGLQTKERERERRAGVGQHNNSWELCPGGWVGGASPVCLGAPLPDMPFLPS